VLRVCEFPRIKGGKAFDPDAAPWFLDVLTDIGQPKGKPLHPEH
jgi:pyrophosphate--fructose-6-phosphate 1-phosphotransferase